MKAREANFDGLVGLTHSYAGLSYGNIASMSHRAQVANPREAALQGLTKAKALADLGMVQGVLAPQERPDLPALRRLGFSGTDAEVLQTARKKAPELLAACSSASSMWTANAATVSPSADALDGRVHFTPANLNEKFHRAIENETTGRILQAVFPDPKHFAHHPALPASGTFGDEGAANHTRFAGQYGEAGVQLFVFGRVALDTSKDAIVPKHFPARQTREASEAVARLHQLRPENTIFAQQNPVCIDGGAFHNDVVSVGNGNVFFHHEMAFLNSPKLMSELKSRFAAMTQGELITIEVPTRKVSLENAVKSYLFNSQLITTSSGHMTLIAPKECQENESVHAYLEELVSSRKTPIHEVRHFDLRQSMQNGGGPACLRLRVVLTDQELAKTNSHVLINDQTYKLLSDWVRKHYRDRLVSDDLGDPKFLRETRTALDELTQILRLGSIYPFQRG